MKVKLIDVKDGSYNISGTLLKFHVKEVDTDEDGDNSHINLVIDKKSALEIMITLLDSQNLSTTEAEKWSEMIEKIEDEEEVLC